jgi:hypothetical protein
LSKTFRIVVTSALLIGGGTSVAAAAPAATPSVTKVESVRIFGPQIKAAAAATTPAASRAAADAYVAKQATEGRFLDVKNVYAASVGGGTVTWESGSGVDEVRLERWAESGSTAGPDGDIVRLAVIGSEDESQVTQPQAAVAGTGMTAARRMTGGKILGKYCQTWTSRSNSVTGCQEKIKPTDDQSTTRDYYFYNRWGTAQGQSVFGPDWQVVEFDMRSRPRDGYEGRTKGMSDYFPNDAEQLCDELGSVSLGHGSLNLTIGLTNCSEKFPIINATTKTMGLKYDAGFFFESRTKGLDYSQEIFAFQGEAQPLMGTYNDAKFCRGTLASCRSTIGLDGW